MPDKVVINKIADMMFPSLMITKHLGRAYVSFNSFKTKERIRKRWDPQEGSHYPSWSRSTPWGGTRSMAIDLLCRFMLGKSVAPIGTWHYLIDGPAKMLSDRAQELKDLLVQAEWPDTVPCILCGKPITQCGDWWTIDKGSRRVSGPSCSMKDCRIPKEKEQHGQCVSV